VQYERLIVTIDQYKIFLAQQPPGNGTALSMPDIKKTLEEVNQFREQARRAKMLNKVSPEWEEGVKGLATAYQLLSTLDRDLQDLTTQWRRAAQPKNEQSRRFKNAALAFAGGLTAWAIIELLTRAF
jgi:hypothetical protein